MTETTFQNWEAAGKKRNGQRLKRLFDIVLALVLLVPVIPALAVLYVVVLVKDGRPFIYRSRRNTAFNQEFDLMKIRTMRTVPEHENVGITGGHKKGRITALGRFLRDHRLDELPQLWNVLKGEMSFVGPRPPEPRYVATSPEIYQQVLLDRPGITGLASIIFHAHEEKMLAECSSQKESEEVYIRRCIPRKAHLDLIYHRNKSLMLDLYVLYLTAAKLLPLPGRRAARIRGQ
ncbi:Sugar transferase involved in LPS biosynthesis (colanic, teichoic acid) [Aliiroseovarius halocynthiae]|uniref:Sugar transferase n=1 Tax=Aliiroseovarius halocynthiae TaxID=985055 RepID=A0A545SNA4_9RHOB|nr:sugar transferase [Aliiroseovarius halocynthiae]TQV66441.1 sugar transferase [Aliiroseovarius halocynthiae]SMR83588.1 Sugar transferase involved in LPS biosynthesis (colanic, teichoic acid) [Aliiroseovarius halocynthiae]